jgi:hypothetical protein
VNLFIYKKDEISSFVASFGGFLKEFGAIESVRSRILTQLETNFRSLPTLGFSFSPNDEHNVSVLLEATSLSKELTKLLRFSEKHRSIEDRDFLARMTNNGDILDFNISFQEVETILKFLEILNKMLDAKVDSTFEFVDCLLRTLRFELQNIDTKKLVTDLSEISDRVEKFYCKYNQSPEACNDRLKLIIEDSFILVELSESSQEFDACSLIKTREDGPSITIPWPSLEELKVKLIIGGLKTSVELQNQLHKSFLQLMEILSNLKRVMTQLYHQGDIIDLRKAIEIGIAEDLKEAFSSEAEVEEVSLTKLKVKFTTYSLASSSIALLAGIEKTLSNLYSGLIDPRSKRQNNQSRFRLYLNNKQKHQLAKLILKKEVQDQSVWDPFTGIIRYTTGIDNPQLRSEVLQMVTDNMNDTQVYSTALFEKVSKLIFKTASLKREVLLGKVEFSEYQGTLLEPFLKHFISKDEYASEISSIVNKVFLCNSVTTNNDIEVFIERALTDPSQAQYYILDCHLAKTGVFRAAVDHLKFMFSDHRNYCNDKLLLLFAPQAASIRKTLENQPDIFVYLDSQKVSSSVMNNKSKLDRLGQLKASLRTQVVVSPIAGLGKTTYIQIQARTEGLPLVVMHLSGESSESAVETRLEAVASHLASRPGVKFALHLKVDMDEQPHTQADRLNQLFFKLVFLKAVAYKGGWLFLDGLERVFVELSNNCRDQLIDKLSVCTVETKVGLPHFDFYQIDPELLQQGDNRYFDVFCAYYHGLKFTKGKLPLVSLRRLTDEGGKLDFQILAQTSWTSTKELLIEQLREAFKDFDRTNAEISFDQLKALIETCARQLIEFDKVGSLMVDYNDNLKAIQAARPKFIEIIFQSAFNSIFGSNQEKLRKETKKTREAMEQIRGKTSGEVIDVVEEIRKLSQGESSWQKNIQDKPSLFVKDGAIAVLCKEEKLLPSEIKTIFSTEAKGFFARILNQRKSIISDDLVERLAQGLELEKLYNQKADPEYLNFKNLPGNSLIHDNDLITKFLKKKTASFKTKGFVVTKDNFLKLMMLVQRVDYSLPIVIMGATGCGKTFLVEFAATCLMQDQFVLIGVHPGKTEAELVSEVNKAIDLAVACKDKKIDRVWVLFDEFNTSPLQCLISEIIIERRASFSPDLKEIPSNLVFLAACNPYKLAGNISAMGLVNEASTTILAHRVFPIPERLISLLWDFDQLDSEVEVDYIKSMIENHQLSRMIGKDIESKTMTSKVIIESQKFIREKEGNSSVSLRDVSRFLTICAYCKSSATDYKTALAVATFISYYLRIDDRSKRGDLDRLIKKETGASFTTVFNQVITKFAEVANELELIPKDVALNRPLKENLFSLVLTQALKIPIIICGKPGTSKTLSAGIAYNIFEG